MRESRAIQICGTGSGVGKSIITCALCRIFLEDGYTVAPFKSQNMALNSFVTEDGREIARAQAIQAQAARIAPSADMNPILIKPSSDRRAQIILMGRPVKSMSVYEYKGYKRLVFTKVKQSLKRLQAKYEVVVIEGAGSPAEVNLKSHDLVNLRIAALAKAAVILVGDIDKGGVFASLIGTLQLLSKQERSMIKGFIINKFRGDLRLLRPGLTFLEKYTGIKVLGVLPYFKDIDVGEEDSLPQGPGKNRRALKKALKISVVYLPHISNFTDFDALAREPDVSLSYAQNYADLEAADAIIIPGSKNTIEDLAYLKKCGIARKIVSLFNSRRDLELAGICGGYQMLGRKICDAASIESKLGSITGLGILPITTSLREKKVLCQVKGRHIHSGIKVYGYEVHHGWTKRYSGIEPLFKITDSKYDGAQTQDRRCWGTYLHGVFDADGFRRNFLNRLRRSKGWLPLKTGYSYNADEEIAKLAAAVRRNLKMKELYRVLN